MLCVPCVCPSQPPTQSDASSTEFLVKAAFVYNFTQFVDWPAGSFARNDSPIVIGLVGSDPLGQAIEHTIQEKRTNGRPFVIRRLGIDAALRECHMVVVSRDEAQRLDKIVEILQSAPVLTIGESQGFANRGGIINLVLQDGKIGMEVNVLAARMAHLSISSKLLSLARIVQ